MRWRKQLRLAIALFVVAFAALVVVSLRRGQQKPAADALAPKTLDPAAVIQGGAGVAERTEKGKTAFSIKFGSQLTYPDNRNKFGGGVTVVLPDRDGRQVTIAAQDAEVTTPPGRQIGTAIFNGGVTLTTSDGVTVKAPTATYDDDRQMTRIPGPVTFQKGRMTGNGVGATYDQARSVLWILDQAKVDVGADAKGEGAIHVTSTQAGMARADHYMKFTGGVHLEGEGQLASADDATAYLTDDDERMTRMELRGNSRIQSKPGSAGPQDMRARDIDLSYAENGRTLQSAHLVDQAVVQLQPSEGRTGRRVSARTIDIALGPDGSTVTQLAANETVQVDLPPEAEIPGRRIRAAALLATGAPATDAGPGGIQAATFTGHVEYRESRPAKGPLTAIDRTATSEKLDIRTKPGFGDLEHAEFHGSVHFTDGPDTTADAPTAVYTIAQDRLDLSPGAGDTGRGPHVADGRITVEARNIHMGLSAQKMDADTNVRTVMIARAETGKPAAAGKDESVKVPSMLRQDQPVNVKSNRLAYDSANSVAIYSGNARLWQDPDTEIRGDTLVIEDKTGNLHATSNVVTQMALTQAGERPGAGRRVEPTITKAADMLYEDAAHRATYTGSVHTAGPSGEVTSDALQLYLAEQGGQLERAEAEGHVVSRQVDRRAFGQHLTYVAKDDIYTMTGTPAMVYDDQAPNCKLTKAPTVTFHKAANTSSAIGGTFGQQTASVPCGTGPGSH